MRLTAQVLNQLGSGADPSDTQCMAGFEMWSANMVSGETLTQSLARLKSLIADGAVDKDLGTFAYAWGVSLKADPSAIMLGGDGYVSTSSYKVSEDPEGRTFQTEADAISYIDQLAAIYANERLPKLKRVVRQGQMQMTDCADPSDGDEVAVFDAFTGNWVFFEYSQSAYDAAIALIRNSLVDQAKMMYAVMVQIVDDIDGLSVWVKQSEIADII